MKSFRKKRGKVLESLAGNDKGSTFIENVWIVIVCRVEQDELGITVTKRPSNVIQV
jgi:hypothetical protein